MINVTSGIRQTLLGKVALMAAFWVSSCGERAAPPSLEESVHSQESPAASERGPLVVEPLATRGPRAEGAPLFSPLAPEVTGITAQNSIEGDHPLRRLYHSGFACGGVALGDLDGDGWPEVFVASGPGQNRLYRQTAPWRFTEVTSSAGVGGGERWGGGVAFVDIDGDADLDIYVCNYDAPNALYLNESADSLRFREAAAEFGLDLVDSSLMPSFCDYDRDGDLDCWILTNRLYRPGGRPEAPPFIRDPETGRAKVKPEFAKYYEILQVGPNDYTMDELGRSDRLLRNEGGRFVDVSEAAGIAGNGFGLSATWWDYNADGWMDLYVCNDFIGPDCLFRNNGDGTFSNVIAETVNAIPWFSMGSDAADLNNDGAMDFVALDMAATTHYKSKMAMGEMNSMRWRLENIEPRQLMRNMCYLNTGTGRFLETAPLAGIAKSDWSWAPKLADFDNDGRVDLFISNGMTRDFNNSDIEYNAVDFIGKTEWDHYRDTPTMPEQNLAYRNVDGLRFEDVSAAWGLDHTGMSFGAAYGDLDRDGDLDLVVVNLDAPVSVYQNHSDGSHHVAVVALKGAGENTQALGAQVRLETASGRQHVRQLMPTTGFLSQNDLELVFGLGEDADIAELMVTWPNGDRQRFENLKAGHRFLISQQPSTDPASSTPSAVEPLFAPSRVLQGLAHREKAYEDFDRQLLLPNKLSQLGPGLAWGDVDQDGDEDLYVGAARGMGGAVLLNEGVDASGVCQFSLPTAEPFLQDAERENMGALFFDAEGDGDLDLFVANGSYEYEANDPRLRDQLYLNNGQGRFSKAAAAFPDRRDASSCVVGADFDRDGDVDLFVGGRVIPGRYPEVAASRLWINESAEGKVAFREAEEASAPGLRAAGLVTGALWSDANGDGWVDLWVTSEWGPVKLFVNREGRLVEGTREAGLADQLGWWNAIAGADIDRDGDVDYAVANFGWNTKYKATEEKPSLLYYGDYGGEGKMSLIEAKYEDKTLLPVRGKSCSTHAMPHLAQKFSTYHDFASASLSDIYAPSELEQSLKLSATTLSSAVLLNDGQGRFTFQPLPTLAQISPAFGMGFLDADADGFLDLFMAQNFYTPQFETGPYSSGLGLLLKGDGAGGLEAVWPQESGLLIPGDAKAATMVDLNRDGRLDLAISQNDGPLLVFENQARGPGKFLRVRLQGGPGNPTAVGARVLAHFVSGTVFVQERYAGSGYLSQSTSDVVIPLGAEALSHLEIRWPDGGTTEVTDIPSDGEALVLRAAP